MDGRARKGACGDPAPYNSHSSRDGPARVVACDRRVRPAARPTHRSTGHPDDSAAHLPTRAVGTQHAGPAFCYWYDVSFDETLRRHATKPNADAFGEAEMREWWHGLDLIEGLDEKLLDETLSLEEARDRVLADCWP